MHSEWLKVVPWIIDAARMKAQGIERFRTSKQGCVRVCAYAKCDEAKAWFGGLGSFKNGVSDIADIEFAMPIVAGGSTIAVFVEDGKEIHVNTYAVTAMKIADCSRAQHLDLPALSGLSYDARQDNDTECGYGKWAGALCVRVNKRNNEGVWSEFCGIYISVSGADEYDDLRVAKYATYVIKDFFRAEGDNFMIDIPDTYAP